jgi:hypothetical protein
MADVTAAVEQELVADSLLGDAAQTETVSEEPLAGVEAEAVEVDAEEPGEVEQAQVEQGEVEQEENAEDWLPREQDKVFPDETYAKYAQRYQLSPEQASDPLIRQLLHDKINSDIFLRQQQDQQALAVAGHEPEPTRPESQQPPTLEQHFANLSQWAATHTDPRAAQLFADQFVKAFGMTEATRPEVARALTQTMTTFGLNLMQTALPQMLLPMMESVVPGFSGMYFQSARAQSWDAVRNSSPELGNLPAYGTREFMELCARLDAEYPALTEMGYTLEQANGGQLYGPAADKFYATLAKLASRQQLDPQLLVEAAQAGARSAHRANVTRQAGNLGAGQSKGAIQNRSGSSAFNTNQDIFDDEAMVLYQNQHGRL